jgi:dihydrofolate reductase
LVSCRGAARRATWPNIKGDRYFDRINGLKKLVASTTLDAGGAWNGSTIKGNVVAEIVRLKGEPGKNIVKYGTARLYRTLFEHRLVDELHLSYFPVVIGRGPPVVRGHRHFRRAFGSGGHSPVQERHRQAHVCDEALVNGFLRRTPTVMY